MFPVSRTSLAGIFLAEVDAEVNDDEVFLQRRHIRCKTPLRQEAYIMNTTAVVSPVCQLPCPDVESNAFGDRVHRSAIASPVLIVAETENQSFYRSMTPDKAACIVCGFDEVLHVVQEIPPEVAVVDCGDDIKLGLALVRRLKGLAPSTPVIFITSASSEEIVIEAFRTGVRDFQRKPITPTSLTESIASLLEIRSATGERRIPLYLKKADHRASTLSQGPPIPPKLRDVLLYIEANLTTNITLDELAKEASISKYHFCKVFKKHFTLSPLKYVAYKRIELARELLKRSDLNVSLTAGEVGFQDISNFSKQFRKFTGLTPMSYRSFFADLGREIKRHTEPV